ncbi:MAG: hypothetical protein L6M37_05340 [Candidatus Methylarchaceae archaeon HK02M1]|nr:hypothetical protein [Candidatus Methylarchaceae archaeon HK02M1]
MPTCPTCRSNVSEPLRTWPIVKAEKNGEIVDCTVGIYWCTKCNIKFPFAVGRQRLKLIETDKLEELHDKIKMVGKVKQELMKKVDQLEQEKAIVEESLILARLEDKAENLKVEISLLKEVKRELESMIKYLDHTPSLKVETSK